MKKHSAILFILVSISFLNHSSPIKKLKEAIELYDVQLVENLIQEVEPLSHRVHRELVAYATKWKQYRKTVWTKDTEIAYKIGKLYAIIGGVPLALVAASSFIRKALYNNTPGPILGMFGGLCVFISGIGILIMHQARNNENTLQIEQKATQIATLIGKIRVKEHV